MIHDFQVRKQKNNTKQKVVELGNDIHTVFRAWATEVMFCFEKLLSFVKRLIWVDVSDCDFGILK